MHLLAVCLLMALVYYVARIYNVLKKRNRGY